MKRTQIFLLLFIGIIPAVFSQQSLSAIRKKSYNAFLYRIPADTAEKYLRHGIKEIDHYLLQTPAMIFHADSVKYDKIPVGNYLLVSVRDSLIDAKFYCSTQVLPFIINDQVKPQVLLRDGTGNLFSNALVWVNDKPAVFNTGTSTYIIKNKKPDEAFMKIIVPGDTSFTEIVIGDENFKTVRQQKAERFRGTTVGKVIRWLPVKMARLFDSRNKKIKKPEGKGYVVFNKPKYFPSDTIKFKAYLLDKKGRQYKKPVNAFLHYSAKSGNVSHKLISLQPVSPGAFVYEFATGDTLPNDTRYTLQFHNKKDDILLNSQFRIEDYLLDEVATYNISSIKEKYYAGDTLQFSAIARDANGLAVMDGNVKLVLLAQTIKGFYKERVFVADTLWQQEKTLAIEGDTKFFIPARHFPKADIELKAVAIFKNSNNEVQEKAVKAEYVASDAKIEIKLEDGLIKAVLYKNGESVNARGFMETGITEEPVPVKFPYAAKVDPQTDTYEFYTADEEAIDEWEDFDLPRNYSVTFSRMQQMDTVAFKLNNPNKVPVYYSIYDGDKEIFAAGSSEPEINWNGKIPDQKIFYLFWQYYWAGKEEYGRERITLLSKLMTTEIGGAATVYPGQTDTITVRVKDYKQKVAGNVNLTAVSYNSQFAASSRVPEPPYIQKFRGKQPILHDRYETDKISAKRNFSLGKHQGWRKAFGLDTMQYYQFLFPDTHYHMVKSRIGELLPQVSVYAVQDGVPQEIYLVYINRQLVYYNGVTDKSVYSVSRFPGYAQFIIRLKDKYIQTDSIYLQPYYKHDIVFDIDKKTANYKITDTVNYWTAQEKDLLNRQILRVENNYRNNGGYVWQDDKAYYLGSSAEHITGPFENNYEIQFYKPGDFDFKFNFEPGYRYRISPQVVRLEKIPIISFTDKVLLASRGGAWWPLGDTLKALPVINYEKKKTGLPFLEQQGYNYGGTAEVSRIKLQLPVDSMFVFTIVQNNNVESDYRVLWGRVDNLSNISKGNYTVVLVTKNLFFLQADNVQVDSIGTYCIKFDNPVYESTNTVASLVVQRQAEKRKLDEEIALKKRKEEDIKAELYKIPLANLPAGTGIVSGKITDKKGSNAIPGAVVTLKGYKTGTFAMADGTYILRGIPAGQYILVFSSVGYSMVEQSITIYEGGQTEVNAGMEVNKATLDEVVVTALGVQRQAKELGYSVSVVRGAELTQALSANLQNGLTGKVSGLQVRYDSSGVFADSRITLRGVRSITGSGVPLLIVNGVVSDTKKLSEFNPDEIASISILKSGEATALYGSDGANGAIIITTKGFAPKMLREEFRDYAFWKPNLITDENGETKFAVTYPDNITSWQTYVVGMDKKHRITKASKLVRSFKPMLAQLSAPQFLIEGDTASAVGKKINYTTSPINVNIDFTLNGEQQSAATETIKGNDATISKLGIVANPGIDTITARFSMKAENGFADGEQRKIPVLQKGTMETIGQFNILEGDESVRVGVNENAGTLNIYIQDNNFDLLLDEIEHLKKYPYFCMEQTASKLTGYAMEKKIREALKQPFNNEKEMSKLVAKLQKGQLFDGGWGWWEGSRANITVTKYITRALLQMRSDALQETNIRNALLFLNNELPGMNKHDLLESLYTLNEAGHDMDYSGFLKRLVFDSLTQHQQWQMLSVLQKQQLSYDSELETLLNKKTATMPGGLHWGENCYWWNRNEIATTVLAYKTLERIPGHEPEQKQITQFFLERRKEGHWRNTVESATILSALLPNALKTAPNFTEIATIRISGDTSMTVNTFPFAAALKAGNRNITVSKQGGGIVYFTAYQQVFNRLPQAVDSNFSVNSYFVNSQKTLVSGLKAGEKAIMKVEVEALKDADYVQVEIPIPAGCTYGNKLPGAWFEHREYFRDRVLIFIEQMKKGKYTYEIELEPRYSGNYTINPAKAELMYFPVFYGRDGIKRVEIK